MVYKVYRVVAVSHCSKSLRGAEIGAVHRGRLQFRRIMTSPILTRSSLSYNDIIKYIRPLPQLVNLHYGWPLLLILVFLATAENRITIWKGMERHAKEGLEILVAFCLSCTDSWVSCGLCLITKCVFLRDRRTIVGTHSFRTTPTSWKNERVGSPGYPSASYGFSFSATSGSLCQHFTSFCIVRWGFASFIYMGMGGGGLKCHEGTLPPEAFLAPPPK